MPYRLENGLAPPSSWDGDPAPDLEFIAFAALIAVFPFDSPNGDRPALPAGGSMGDVLAVEEPDLG